MTPINNIQLMKLSIAPILRTIRKMYLGWQLKWIDRNMDVVKEQIDNGHGALSILAKDRANLVNRIRRLKWETDANQDTH